jgi:perosamine synthetase
VLRALSRYGIRVAPRTKQIIEECRRRGQYIQGPAIRELEQRFAARLGGGAAITTSYGRMAFYHLLRAMDLPAGSEVVFPALTFWVMPELARTAGLTPVFADVDPRTFTMDPEALTRAVSPRTRVVVPTHLYGLPCDMDAIMAIARRHGLRVVEDCAHVMGTRYRDQPTGTFGDAAIFSLHTLKPLNAYGGGVAWTHDERLAARVRREVEALRWPAERRVDNRLLIGQLQRLFTSPAVFTLTGFPILWLSSLVGANPDVYLWEPIRRLDPLPDSYLERMPNVQAVLALAGLESLDAWSRATAEHAARLDAILAGTAGLVTPYRPEDREHSYYQYCIYVPARDDVVRRCIRRGVDLETLHVDVCPQLALFDARRRHCPGAERAAEAVQVPVHASLSPRDLERIGRTVKRVVARIGRRGALTAPSATAGTLR